MRRRKDGSAWFVMASKSKRTSKIPDQTQEAVVACRAVQLHYWSGAAQRGCVWAVDEYQRPHLVRINQKNKTAEVICDRADYGSWQQHQHCAYARRRTSYQDPLAADTTLELVDRAPDRSRGGA